MDVSFWRANSDHWPSGDIQTHFQTFLGPLKHSWSSDTHRSGHHRVSSNMVFQFMRRKTQPKLDEKTKNWKARSKLEFHTGEFGSKLYQWKMASTFRPLIFLFPSTGVTLVFHAVTWWPHQLQSYDFPKFQVNRADGCSLPEAMAKFWGPFCHLDSEIWLSQPRVVGCSPGPHLDHMDQAAGVGRILS